MRRGDYKWFSQGLKLSQKLCLCVRKRRHTIHGCTQQMHCCIIRTFIFVRYLMHFFSLYYRQWVRRVHFLLSAGWSKSYRINPIRRIENFATAPLISHFFLRHFNFLSCTSIVLFWTKFINKNSTAQHAFVPHSWSSVKLLIIFIWFEIPVPQSRKFHHLLSGVVAKKFSFFSKWRVIQYVLMKANKFTIWCAPYSHVISKTEHKIFVNVVR